MPGTSGHARTKWIITLSVHDDGDGIDGPTSVVMTLEDTVDACGDLDLIAVDMATILSMLAASGRVAPSTKARAIEHFVDSLGDDLGTGWLADEIEVPE